MLASSPLHSTWHSSPAPTNPSMNKDAFVSILALSSGLLYFGIELYFFSGRPGFPLDDSWIHLQFARQLAEGQGLAYNPGQWVTGSTAPLWTALLSLGFLLPGAGFLLWPKVLGLLLLVLTTLGTARLSTALGSGPRTSALAAVLVATSSWLAWSALSGMEILLFTSLALWGMVAHIRRSPISIALLAASCLARPEGALLLVLALVDRLIVVDAPPEDLSEPPTLRLSIDRGLGKALAVAGILLAPTLAFYFLVGGSFLPTTFGAKARPDLDLWPSLAYLRLVVDILFRSQPILAPLAAAGIVGLLARPRIPHTGRLLPAAWLLGQALFYSVLASEGSAPPVGNFGRYFFPLVPVVVVLGLLGLEPLLDRAAAGLRMAGPGLAGRRWPIYPLVVAILLLPQAFGYFEGAMRHVRTVGNVQDSDVKAALWLRQRLDPEALLGVQDAGALKFFLPNSIVDLAGIIHPEIRPAVLGTSDDPRFPPEVYWEERLARYLEAEAPVDYLVVFSASYPALTSGTVSGFRTVERFAVEDNLAMAGDELVILTTPWTRFPLVDPESGRALPIP